VESKSAAPDYELPDERELTSPAQVRAIAHPDRTTILGLLHERAATVTELAQALGRPKSSVAYHVQTLERAGLVRVVRTRRVRAIDERYYGRTARMFYARIRSANDGQEMPLDFNDFEVAARESQTAFVDHALWSLIRHARIPQESLADFWMSVVKLVQEFDRLPHSGDTTYGFVVGAYPIPGYPALPDTHSE